MSVFLVHRVFNTVFYIHIMTVVIRILLVRILYYFTNPHLINLIRFMIKHTSLKTAMKDAAETNDHY
jgi:hypothetical protein